LVYPHIQKSPETHPSYFGASSCPAQKSQEFPRQTQKCHEQRFTGRFHGIISFLYPYVSYTYDSAPLMWQSAAYSDCVPGVWSGIPEIFFLPLLRRSPLSTGTVSQTIIPTYWWNPRLYQVRLFT